MHPTRRRLLGLLALTPVVALGACAPSPVINGEPAEAWEPVPAEPELDPAHERAAIWVATNQRFVEHLSTLADGWELSESARAWASASLAQAEAQLACLLSADPLDPAAESIFEVSPDDVTLPVVLTEFDEARASHVQTGIDLMRDLTVAAEGQPQRLLFSSLAISAATARTRAIAPVTADAVPVRFPEASPAASLEVAMGHVLALVQGLELALGNLSSGTDRDTASSRLASAKHLRNLIREDPQAPVGQPVAMDLPDEMEQGEFRAGLRILETNVLDALARLTATAGDEWFGPMIEQVRHVQSWGGALPTWPGWAPVS